MQLIPEHWQRKQSMVMAIALVCALGMGLPAMAADPDYINYYLKSIPDADANRDQELTLEEARTYFSTNRTASHYGDWGFLVIHPEPEVPTPEFTSSTKIKNPFYKQPVWRLWAVDQTPVNFGAIRFTEGRKLIRQSFAPPAATNRLYPDFAQCENGVPALKHFDPPPESAGFWDDSYATLDDGHTCLPELSNQYIRVTFGMAGSQARLALGVNLSSKSWNYHGRQIVDDFVSNDETERKFFFANCIRATPAVDCYRITDGVDAAGKIVKTDKSVDLYDGLYGHSYQSIGVSGSELAALHKMLFAGGCMPRATKDLLKLHGAYASAMLTVFKAALPYSDATGQEVPFENELRHRPAYLSSGGDLSKRNRAGGRCYLDYDDAAHRRRMIELARGMTIAPPVAVLKLAGFSVEKGDQTLVAGATNDSRIKTVNKTLMRFWGGTGETLRVRVDLRESYDLQDRPLTYTCHLVYPNQTNVSIEAESSGVYRISARHDPRLPKGRIPVLLLAHNGANLPSNPVFVNFFWPEKDDPEDLAPLATYKGSAMRNLSPIFQPVSQEENVSARPGETVSVKLDARDPEGYPVRFYRWSGEVGQIVGDRFTFDVPKDAQAATNMVHLIGSDGTGRYAGKVLKISIEGNRNSL